MAHIHGEVLPLAAPFRHWLIPTEGPMKPKFNACFAFTIACSCLLSGLAVAVAAEAAPDAVALSAFPGAEGWGAASIGGRGGRVIKVTNLNAFGPGSLAEACAADGPRIVIFEVSGVIRGNIRITRPYITIAGQTAPGA